MKRTLLKFTTESERHGGSSCMLLYYDFIQGGAGHGSKFIKPSATVRLLRVLEKFTNFRASEQQRLDFSRNEDRRPLRLGDVTTTNVTMLNAGVQYNVVHETAEAGVDMRIAPTVDLEKLEVVLRGWCEAESVEMTFVQKFVGHGLTRLDDKNQEWQVIKKVAAKMKIELDPEIFPAATDSRFLRQIGLPAIGISAIKSTHVLLHDHNEYLNEQTLIDGVGFYADVIFGIANIEGTHSVD